LAKAIRSIEIKLDRSKVRSIDRSSSVEETCEMRLIEPGQARLRSSEMRSIDQIFHLPEDHIFQDLLNSLCNSNHKLDSVDRNGRRPALNTWLELILDGLL